LNGHYAGHERYHRQQQRSSANTVDEEPGDETGKEEPSLESATHETREVLIEAQGFVEKGATVVDDGIDTAELLEDLNGAGDEEAAARVDLVGAKDVFPGASIEFCLNADGVDDIGVEFEDVVFGDVVPFETAEDLEGFLLAAVGGEPARGFREDQKEDEHREKEDELEDDRDAPGEGRIVVGETKVDPVDNGDSEVESGELHANIYSM
jgi:hypothetical protein